MPSHVSRPTCKAKGGSIRGGAIIKISALLASACAVLAVAGAASAGLVVGVSEDRGKDTNAAAFFATLNDLGMTQNRASIIWDPVQPNVIAGQSQIAQWLPAAQAAGIRIVFAIAPKDARDITGSQGAADRLAAFVAHVAQTFPQVKDYVIGNEPNQPKFWLPQFDSADRPVAASAYEPMLAASYDALKAVDPAINVIGVGLSPRGNDNPHATSNISRSPVRFIHDLGVAYRASHRAKPIMDELAYHPYPAVNTDPPDTGYSWPNAGLSNLDRVKQAVWDAFHGTAQPTFAETGFESMNPLRLELDEIGWQVAVLPNLAGLYTGTETVPTIDEPTQAEYYGDVIMSSECDPTIRSLSFFLLMDEPDLSHWQSGLERIDGSHRASYDAVKTALAQTHGNCTQGVTTWRHSGAVVLPRLSWGPRRRTARWTKWRFNAGAGEEATYRAGIFKAGTSRRAITRSLSVGRPRAILSTTGTIKAKVRAVAFPSRRLKRGRYVMAIRMTPTMNSGRASLFISPVFRVGI
ncbi:MAG TPA: hypothetical protein VKB73_03015 [Gaiellaceae bacterium]|nr:hypothetical protein [Gaiellaceae bacterium]